ncbi:MAG TPA: hypothetical protein VHU18_00500 [Rhizomicrobium sp.]|jgi:hypothetical protein|nr:hypothetical protein [Rhizomicrobium sp.]
MKVDNDAALAALTPLVAQAALESGVGINPVALEYIAKQAMKRGANANMTVPEIAKHVKAIAVDEPKHFGLRPAQPTENRRERAIHDLERTEALADATRQSPSRPAEPKFSKATKRGLHKFGGASALLHAVNCGEAPAFLNESNVGEGE